MAKWVSKRQWEVIREEQFFNDLHLERWGIEMKASDLIERLQKMIEEYGDLEVEVPKTDDCYYGHSEIQSIGIDDNVIELQSW